MLDDSVLNASEHGVFDPVYSALVQFSEVGADLRDRVVEVALAAVKAAASACRNAINAMAPESELKERRSALEMSVFLLSTLAQEAEKQNGKQTESAPPAAKPRKGAKKSSTVNALTKAWEWEPHREAVAKRLLEVPAPAARPGADHRCTPCLHTAARTQTPYTTPYP